MNFILFNGVLSTNMFKNIGIRDFLKNMFYNGLVCVVQTQNETFFF